jgi:lipopolysaccharide/colanic/teichoic acid biosynthesis glycosyltransferase
MGRLLLVVTSPLLLFLFFLVKLTSPGPGFYRQVRVGLDGKKFEIIKLRSMVDNAEKPGVAVWSTKGDARVTLLGRVLRKLHLDELPQLWNVSVGDMSLVGPRPERPKICEGLAEQIDGYYRRNCIKPGVTGLAQINLPPDESVEDVRRKQILDLYYIEHAGYWLDARMLVATAMRMVGVKGLIVMKLMGLCRLEVVKREELNTELFSNDPPSAHCTLRLHESHSGMHTSESQVESRQQSRSDR